MDPSIAAKQRHTALARAANALGINRVIPPTKADIVSREAFLAEVLAALVDRYAALSGCLDALDARAAKLERKSNAPAAKLAF